MTTKPLNAEIQATPDGTAHILHDQNVTAVKCLWVADLAQYLGNCLDNTVSLEGLYDEVKSA